MAIFVALVVAGNAAQRWIDHTGLAEAGLDGRFSHIEQGRELLGALNAMGEGSLELRAGDQQAAGEVVGGVFSMIKTVRAAAGRIQILGVAVIEDMFVLVREDKPLAPPRLMAIEFNDPLGTVPVAGTGDWRINAGNPEPGQFSDDLFGNWCFGDLLQEEQMRGLQLSQAQGFVEGEGSGGDKGAQASQNAAGVAWV